MQNLQQKEQILSSQEIAALLTWYAHNARDLPWRHTKDPYRIWVSEIMLQQTRVEAVKPYYKRFLEHFPTVFDLASAPEDLLMKLWEGLGYYSRARNLQKAAQILVRDYDGEMPANEEDLRKLPGIGDYTAGAIASIAFGLPTPAVDGNVLRVLTRVNGSYADIGDPKTKTEIRDAVRNVVPEDAGSFTQALIELGACVCVPNGDPQCSSCPLADSCICNREHLGDVLPVKTGKKPRRSEDYTVLILRDNLHTVLRKRPQTGLLAGLYEYPNCTGHLTKEEALAYVRELGFRPTTISREKNSKHIFTHLEWHMIAYRITVEDLPEGFLDPSGCWIVPHKDVQTIYALPSAFAAYFEKNEGFFS